MTPADDERPPPAAVAAEAAVERERHRGRALIGLLSALLGFALVVQVQSNTDRHRRWPSARQEDLVRILSDLDAASSGCSSEIADLEEQPAAARPPARRAGRRRWPRPGSAPTSWASWPARCRRRGRG